MRFAYADPPYLGQSHLYDHPEAHIWDTPEAHGELMADLDYYDGWALSASSPSLRSILPLAPEGVRVAAWVKPFAVFKPNVNPGYAWEPVIFKSGRKRDRSEDTVRDWLSCNITLRKGLVGAKPPEFCRWILDLIGWQPGDDLDDVFPGTGVMDVVTGKTPLQEGLFLSASEEPT
jgi:hypothetical protein